MASSSTKLSRFDLPSLNLPLNFTPHKAYVKRLYVGGLEGTKQITVPATGEEKDLLPSALSDNDGNSQYEPFSRDHRCSLNMYRLPLTTLREFTMLQLMNHLTDKPDWEIKVKPN
jgi:Protein of unknown function (DUF4246)